MCAVSMVHEYGARQPDDFWLEVDNLRAYKRFIEQAKEFDRITGQPDCEDPTKVAKMKRVLDRLDALEKALEKLK